MRLLDPKEIQELRERSAQKSLKIAERKLKLEKQLQLKKDKLQRDYEAYKKIIEGEIQSLTTKRNLLLNEIEKLRNERRAGMSQVMRMRGEAQEIIRIAEKRIKDAESIEGIVESEMAKLQNRGESLKKLLSKD